ncbi:MAG: hypothetical protein ACFFDC_17810 [Promethearchaeota archaeon]
MDEIDFLIFAFFVIIILLVTLKICYTLRPPAQHSEKKPTISFFPKYKTHINLSLEVIENANPIHALAERLIPFGFRLSKSETDFIQFTKGSVFDELLTFSGAKMKLILKFPIPLSQNSTVDVQYATFAGVLFDTGDLWKVTSDLKRNLEGN